MFGVVPRVVWERVCPPDEKNRIRMNMNCLFIDTGNEKILIETGIGEKWSDKQTEMFGISREKPFAESLFDIAGCRPEDITIVINTHLHFDHAGGNTVLTAPHVSRVPEFQRNYRFAGVQPAVQSSPQFSNARYLVSASELEHARAPHERDRVSYLQENWRPMIETGQLQLMPDDYEPVPGLKLQTAHGHSETMQTWRLDRGGKILFGFADLIPTRHHVPLPWIMGYDLYPTKTLEFKRQILPQAVEEKWSCLFYHDLEHPICQIVESDGKIAARPVDW